MIKLFSFLQSRELVGVVCGLGWVAMSPNWERWLWKPTSALMELTMVAMLAAFIVAAAMARAGHRMEEAVRRGAAAGGVAMLMAGAVFLWVVRGTSGFYPLRAWSILATSAMPALLAGSIAAGVGALCFRRRVEPPPDLVELPRRLGWSFRSLLAVGFLSALVAPWIPRSTPKKVETLLSPPVASATSSPSVVSTRPREVFEYTTPESLKGAPAAAWKIKTTRRLGQMQAERGLAFSKDQRFLAGLESDRTIVVHELESEGLRRISGIPYPVLHVAFSPDSERLFVVMQSQPLRVGVGFLKTGSFVLLPQPKKYAVPEGWASWSKEDEVVFLTKSGPTVVLSLHTLEIDPIALSPSELERLKRERVFDFPSNERWAFGRGSVLTFAELPAVEGTREWTWQAIPKLVLADLKRVSAKIFFEITPGSGDAFFGVRDGSKLMQIHDGELSVFYFETGPVPPLHWKIRMPHPPEQMREHELALRTLAKGELSLLMYAPLVNPLNNKVVGPDRERPKAILRVQRWEGTEAEVWIETGIESYLSSDVFADLHVPGDPPHLLSAAQPHPWWVVARDPLPDATDPTKIPLRKALVKELTGEEKTKFASAIKDPADGSAIPEIGAEEDDIRKSVSTFVFAHHTAASEGRLKDVVNDYANQVDHFKNGLVGRDFILKDEVEYHQKYKFVREVVQSALKVKRLDAGKVEVSYLMANEWQRLADNIAGGAVFRIVLTLEEQSNGWKIIRHRADKQN